MPWVPSGLVWSVSCRFFSTPDGVFRDRGEPTEELEARCSAWANDWLPVSRVGGKLFELVVQSPGRGIGIVVDNGEVVKHWRHCRRICIGDGAKRCCKDCQMPGCFPKVTPAGRACSLIRPEIVGKYPSFPGGTKKAVIKSFTIFCCWAASCLVKTALRTERALVAICFAWTKPASSWSATGPGPAVAWQDS